MIRLNIVVEGQTEETFVRVVLTDHLGAFDISTAARSVATSRQGARYFRGGVRSYAQIRRDLEFWMRQDTNSDAYFTTMLDLYALPDDFPDFALASRQPDPYARIELLEAALARDIGHPSFVPYLQLHEFEALLLADPQHFDWFYTEHDSAIERLKALVQRQEPEMINDGATTAPSKRIIAEIPEYEGQKVAAGPLIAQKIGLPTLRMRCPHFAQWLEKLERLAERESS